MTPTTTDFIRRLQWNPNGYQPIGYNWPNYRPNHSSTVISHDLYHHQVGESGLMIEEFRALGAQIRFPDFRKTFNEQRSAYADLFLKEFGRNNIPVEWISKYNYYPINPDNDIYNFCLYYLGSIFPDALTNILMEGYHSAWRFSERAYQNVRNFNFFETWKHKDELDVNLETGEVFLV